MCISVKMQWGVRANDENIRSRLIDETLVGVDELGSQRFRLSLVSPNFFHKHVSILFILHRDSPFFCRNINECKGLKGQGT
jgi:hypothetical protein